MHHDVVDFDGAVVVVGIGVDLVVEGVVAVVVDDDGDVGAGLKIVEFVHLFV